jgi:hypothetical protein
VRETDDLPATVWWGVQVRQSSPHTCTVQCTRAGILCSSDIHYLNLRFFATNLTLQIKNPVNKLKAATDPPQQSSDFINGKGKAVAVLN